jgi:RES domain
MALEYITTQAIADFLSTDPAIDIDGIIYPSIQAGGGSHNVVLFHKAALVEPIEVSAGARTEVQFGYGAEDGWEVEYSVSEILEEPSKVSKIGDISPGASLRPSSGYDNRTPTVRIDRNNIYVHIVRSVEFYTADYLVHFRRIDLSNAPF